MKAQRIRTKVRMPGSMYEAVLGGWLGENGQGTYLWLRVKGQDGKEHYTGIVDGPRLYRLAKAIVARFESHQS